MGKSNSLAGQTANEMFTNDYLKHVVIKGWLEFR